MRFWAPSRIRSCPKTRHENLIRLQSAFRRTPKNLKCGRHRLTIATFAHPQDKRSKQIGKSAALARSSGHSSTNTLQIPIDWCWFPLFFLKFSLRQTLLLNGHRPTGVLDRVGLFVPWRYTSTPSARISLPTASASKPVLDLHDLNSWDFFRRFCYSA